MRPFIGHKGGLELIAELHGTAGHASDPRGTVNSIYYAARLIRLIEEKAKSLAARPNAQSQFDPPYSTLSVGRLEGGVARNIIPSSCRFLYHLEVLLVLLSHLRFQHVALLLYANNIILLDLLSMLVDALDSHMLCLHLQGRRCLRFDLDRYTSDDLRRVVQPSFDQVHQQS